VPEISEIHLIEAATGGDIESFGELCRRYYAAMAAIAYAVLSDHQLAEDAAQESFARALVRIKSLKERAKFAPWLAAICRNVAKDMLATKAKQISTEDLSQVAQKNKIASILGVSPAAINGRLARAKRKMAKYLKRNGFPENRL
jgi:DNA-directed RNA polymerase specialized sigma24 family protein